MKAGFSIKDYLILAVLLASGVGVYLLMEYAKELGMSVGDSLQGVLSAPSDFLAWAGESAAGFFPELDQFIPGMIDLSWLWGGTGDTSLIPGAPDSSLGTATYGTRTYSAYRPVIREPTIEEFNMRFSDATVGYISHRDDVHISYQDDIPRYWTGVTAPRLWGWYDSSLQVLWAEFGL